MCSDPAASAEDRAAFVAWLRRSNLHVEEFLRLSALTQRLAGAELWPGDRPEELVARALAEREIPRVGEPGPAATRSDRDQGAGRGTRVWALAASVLLVVAAAVLFILRPELFDRDRNSYSTAVGEMRSIALPDGSVVELNTQSRLRMRFSETVRLVELVAGEAIFKVAKDRDRPFRVVAGASEIVAVGTAFNVYADQSRTVVTVLEGRVRVSARTPPPTRAGSGAPPVGAEVELGSGEQAVIAPRRPIARVKLADATRVTSWTERRLIFEDASLAAVAAEFARYSPRVIRIGDAALAERQITGVFDASDPASLVQFLGAQGDMVIEQTADGWTLSAP